jgi:hypothetical protein
MYYGRVQGRGEVKIGRGVFLSILVSTRSGNLTNNFFQSHFGQNKNDIFQHMQILNPT